MGAGGAQASLTEHEELEVPLGGPRLVLCPTGVEAGIALLDPGKVEGPGPIQEAVAAHLGDLGRRGQRELVGGVGLHTQISSKRKLRPREAGWRPEPRASDSENRAVPSHPCRRPGFTVGPQSSTALNPRAALKTPITLSYAPTTPGAGRNPPEGLYPTQIPPAARPPPGTPTSCPSLSHVISGAGKPCASHSSRRDWPAMPDTLALRPSSRMLGGTWEQGEAEELPPPQGQPRPPRPCLGHSHRPGEAALTPSPSRFWGCRMPAPVPGLAIRSHMDLGMATAARPWDLALVVPRNRATLSDIQLYQMGIHPARYPGCCHGHLGGSPSRNP